MQRLGAPQDEGASVDVAHAAGGEREGERLVGEHVGGAQRAELRRPPRRDLAAIDRRLRGHQHRHQGLALGGEGALQGGEAEGQRVEVGGPGDRLADLVVVVDVLVDEQHAVVADPHGGAVLGLAEDVIEQGVVDADRGAGQAEVALEPGVCPALESLLPDRADAELGGGDRVARAVERHAAPAGQHRGQRQQRQHHVGGDVEQLAQLGRAETRKGDAERHGDQNLK
jgi:hypothetical protein